MDLSRLAIGAVLLPVNLVFALDVHALNNALVPKLGALRQGVGVFSGEIQVAVPAESQGYFGGCTSQYTERMVV